MIRINLLPFRAARKKENVRRQVGLFLISIICVLGVMFWYNMRLGGRIDRLETEIGSLNKKLVKYAAINKEIAKLEAQLKILLEKTKVIAQLEANREGAVILLDSLSRLMEEPIPTAAIANDENKEPEANKRLWLLNMQAVGASVTLRGIAYDNKTVADFMRRLQNASYLTEEKAAEVGERKKGEDDQTYETRLQSWMMFSNVRLVNTRHIRFQGKYNLKEFLIKCTWAPVKKAPAKEAKTS